MSAVLLAQGALMRGFNPPGTVPNNIMISRQPGHGLLHATHLRLRITGAARERYAVVVRSCGHTSCSSRLRIIVWSKMLIR